MQNEIFGIKTNNSLNFEDKFKCVFDDLNAFYESKETFHHKEDGLKFDYKYCVQIIDLESATGEDENKNKFGIELNIVPTFNSLHKKQQESLLDCCGINENEVNSMDICGECSVMVGYEEIVVDDDAFDNGEGFEGCKPIMEKLNTIANVFETINALRGFYLDKNVNAIGTTGWDLLDSFINGSDWVKKSLDRLKKS